MRGVVVLLMALAACDSGARFPALTPQIAQPALIPTIPAAFIALHRGEDVPPIMRAVLRSHDPVEMLPAGSVIASYSFGDLVPAVRTRVRELAAIDTARRILFVFEPDWDYSVEGQRALGELRAEIDQVGVRVVTLSEMACIEGGPMGGRPGPLGVDVPVTTYESSAPEIAMALRP